MTPSVSIIHGDFETELKKIDSSSVDLVFTDPPYGRSWLYIWEILSRESSRIIIPGGSLITLSGIISLPIVLNSLNRHMDYFWCGALLHNQVALVESVNLFNTWKPILWFTKGEKPLYLKEPIPDGVSPFEKQKYDHRWQQAETWAEHFITSLCPPDGLVVDPFVGTGTTAVVCLRANRRCIGIDNDTLQVNKALSRVDFASKQIVV